MAKVGEVVKFGDRGISVEEARRKMLEAGQAPKGIQSETRKNEAVGVIRGVGGNTPAEQQTQSPAPVIVTEAPAATAVKIDLSGRDCPQKENQNG